MMEPSLNDKERCLLRYLYDEPDASFQQIADALQLGHKETARRLLKRLRQKLSKYNETTLNNVGEHSEAGCVAS
jgi:DNA-binding Lrp family transcriptional regulator